MSVRQQVVVHGGGGYVGSAILRALAASPDLAPVAGVRRRPASPAGPYRLCDATDPRAVAEAQRGAAFAVNAVLGDPATMLAATRAICAAARDGGLRRLVHVSSISVYGAAEGRVSEDAALAPVGASTRLAPVGASTRLAPTGASTRLAPVGASTRLAPVGAYAAAKIGCEAIVRDFVDGGGEAVILRPGIVYGPGGEQWLGRLGRLLRARRLGDLGAAGDGFCNLIHHDDVGAAVRAALTAPGAAGQAINLAPLAPPTWNDVLVGWARAIGATPVRRISARQLRLQGLLLAPPLQVAKLAAARLGLRPGLLPEPIPPSLLALFRQRLVLDGARAHALLGLARTPWEDALAACGGWFLERRR